MIENNDTMQMMRYLFLVLATTYLGAFKATAQCADTNLIYSFTYISKTYEVVKEAKTWSNAAACAVERGGYLAEINDANEQSAIYYAILNSGVSNTYTSISNGGGIAYIWIGATDQAAEGTWLWDGNNDHVGVTFYQGQGSNGSGNGSPVNGMFNNWGGKTSGTNHEPDNYNAAQHYGAIGLAGWPAGTTTLGSASEWNDLMGSSLCYFIVEKDSNLGMSEFANSVGLSVYPNPCAEQLTISVDQLSLDAYFELVDMTGRLFVKQPIQATMSLNTSEYLPGMYYLCLVDGTTIHTVRFSIE